MKLTPYLTLTTLILALLLALSGGAYAAAGREDNADRLSQNQSYTFSPGYINAAMQRAENIMNQAIKRGKAKGNIDEAEEEAVDKSGRDIKKQSHDKEAPHLLMKTGSTNEGGAANTAGNTQNTIKQAGADDINIGEGIQYGADRALIIPGTGQKVACETIGGKTYVLAGFSNGVFQSVQEAIDFAQSGETVIVKGGNVDPGQDFLTPKTGVNLLGGYAEDGSRDFANSSVLDSYVGWTSVSEATEISGFTFNAMVYFDSSSLIIKNNTFKDTLYLWGTGSSIVENNIFDGPYATFGAWREANVLLKGNDFKNGPGLDANQSGHIISQNNNFARFGMAQNGARNFGTLISQNDYFQTGYRTISNTPYLSIQAASIAPNLSVGIINPTTFTIVIDSGISTLSNNTLEHTYPLHNQFVATSDINLNANGTGDAGYSLLDYKMKRETVKKDEMMSSAFGQINNFNPVTGPGIMRVVNESAVSPIIGNYAAFNPQDMSGLMALVNILNNPSSDQKIMIDSITLLLQDVNKVEVESGTSPELTKAQNELIQMVAQVLLAQAMPDLFKAGEMAGMKDIFKDLDTQKTKVMLDYQTTTTPYYESIKKDLAKNMAILQMNNIFSKGMLEEDLKNASRSDIEKIIEKLRKTSDKFREKDYILQQEAKYREKYLDPNKKKLEADTRVMLNDFTRRLSERLEQAKR